MEDAKRLAFLAEFEDEEETPPPSQSADWSVVLGGTPHEPDEHKNTKKHKNKGFIKNCGLCEKPYNTNAMPNKVNKRTREQEKSQKSTLTSLPVINSFYELTLSPKIAFLSHVILLLIPLLVP